ncbi:response regulator [Maribacter sp. MMG018]|uniref:response regulator n=1 Tax=Maribacter sp. MMG018 TaxID=2822688 RepID=UPI001B36E59F|nr:response regulator [Maribacter sp. MMG018]MBQ4913140.1 response regulator [Maribacter sp. MMG018]
MNKFESCCIIDDDEFFAFHAKKLMKETNFCENVLWYSDGQEAIDSIVGLLIENIKIPEIILLDLNMPEKDGWDFLEEFDKIPKDQRSDVKIFIVSSFISPENMTKAKSFKMVEQYLVKPLTKESLDQIKETVKNY